MARNCLIWVVMVVVLAWLYFIVSSVCSICLLFMGKAGIRLKSIRMMLMASRLGMKVLFRLIWLGFFSCLVGKVMFVICIMIKSSRVIMIFIVGLVMVMSNFLWGFFGIFFKFVILLIGNRVMWWVGMLKWWVVRVCLYLCSII